MSPPEKGVCIELSVTSTVEEEDDRDAVKAGTRVAGKVSGKGRPLGEYLLGYWFSSSPECSRWGFFVAAVFKRMISAEFRFSPF